MIRLENHVIIIDDYKGYLLDTGSPMTFCENECVKLFGKVFPASKPFFGSNLQEINDFIGLELEALIGCDILNQFDIVFREKEGKVVFYTEFSITNEERVDIHIIGGVPCFRVEVNSQTINVIFDTGAKISYINENYVSKLTPKKTLQDFNPIFGSFETNIYEIPIKIAKHTLVIDAGVLPKSIENQIRSINCYGIFGPDIFFSFTVGYCPRRGFMFFAD